MQTSFVERKMGKLALIESAGHYPQTEMPEQTAPIIVEFLRQGTNPPVSTGEAGIPTAAAMR